MYSQGRIQRFWKRGVLYVSHHCWPTKKILGFRWSKKVEITLENNVFDETFLSVFSNFLHFNESLQMKSYQILKIYKRFYKQREKAIIQQSMRKEKLRKFELFFIEQVILWLWKWQLIIFPSIGLFVHKIFFILQVPSQRNFCFLMSGWRKKYQKGKLGMTNS